MPEKGWEDLPEHDVGEAPNRFDVDIPMTGVVPKFERTPGSIDATGPLLGEHSEVVLRELVGLDAGEFDTLVARGVVGVTVGS